MVLLSGIMLMACSADCTINLKQYYTYGHYNMVITKSYNYKLKGKANPWSEDSKLSDIAYLLGLN